MASWKDFAATVPELAATVRDRLERGRYALLGSLRADGFPRISGVIVTFADGELWLGMPESVKAADLRRDLRMSLHSSASAGGEGDAKLHGRAEQVAEGPQRQAFLDRIPHAVGAGGLALFRIDVVDASAVRLTEQRDAHVIESWREGQDGVETRLS